MMKKILFYAFLLFLLRPAAAQVTCDPVFPVATDEVTIYFDATQGNGALAGFAGPVYAHMGVITNESSSPSDWKHVTTTWGVADPVGLMTNEAPNIWKKTFTINTFFNIQPGETVLKLAFVFRNQSGSLVGRAADGSDIFYDVYPDDGTLQTTFVTPATPSLLVSLGQPIVVKAAASQTATLRLLDNGAQVANTSGEVLETVLTAGATGLHTVQFIATTATDADTATFVYVVPANLPAQDPPAGTEWGINYVNDQTVRFALYAPDKQVVFVLGDFNNWQADPAYQMRQSLDGTLWWLEIGGLTPGEVYRFQYLVDGVLKIADPLSTLVLDPWNDPFIPAITWPNLPAYPTGSTTGIVSVLQTAQPPFNWTAVNYERPKKTDLVVYELLVRDFLHRHDYETLLDTLDYLEKLGVTAIELMPVNEFDGNINWGYGPSFHKALDKYYGTPEALKLFIDECHQRNIAVILDVVFNQATAASPLAQLYWNAATNQPAADNPWLNPVAPHPFSVFQDFNHESAATKTYVKNCVAYWLEEFKFDGFRFDLSKGFTQFNSGANVGLWGQYDASRVAIWKDYADFVWSVDPTAYVILEHFADNTEEKELAEYGMMFWGNMWERYKDVALGYTTGVNTSLLGIAYTERDWSVPHLIGYMESHDEQRIVYECKTFGNVVGSYNIKSLPTALRRVEMLNNLFYTVPGPKMLWQFGELGYDYSINTCPDGTINNNCRTDPKPIRWDYLDDPYRRRLYNVTAALLNLRKNYDAFETTDFSLALGAGQIRTIILAGTDLRVVAVANVGTTNATANLAFQNAETLYEYYTGETLNVTAGINSIPLEAGEYRLYLDQFVPLPPGVVIGTTEKSGLLSGLEVYPNPVGNVFVADFALRNGAGVFVEVFDLTGRAVFQMPATELPAGEHQLEIEAAHWPAGIYQLSLRDESGARLTRKLVKM